MKKAIIIPILLLLSSCLTQKKVAKICARCPVNSVTKDSIVIVKRDTTIYITHREVEYRDTIICDPSGKVEDFRKTVSSGGIKATISMKSNKLKVVCETDSLYQVIKGLISERSQWSKVSNTKVVEVCTKEHKTKFDGFTFWWFWITSVLIGLKFGLKYLKVQIPFLK